MRADYVEVTIIAEIGSNWEGDLEKAKKLISKSKKAGADLVKFQMWRYKKTLFRFYL